MFLFRMCILSYNPHCLVYLRGLGNIVLRWHINRASRIYRKYFGVETLLIRPITKNVTKIQNRWIFMKRVFILSMTENFSVQTFRNNTHTHRYTQRETITKTHWYTACVCICTCVYVRVCVLNQRNVLSKVRIYDSANYIFMFFSCSRSLCNGETGLTDIETHLLSEMSS